MNNNEIKHAPGRKNLYIIVTINLEKCQGT